MVSPIPAGGDEIGELVAKLRDKIVYMDEKAVLLSNMRKPRTDNDYGRAAGLMEASVTALEQLQRERDAALAEIERMIPQFVAYEYLESPARADIAEAALTAATARISALEASLNDAMMVLGALIDKAELVALPTPGIMPGAATNGPSYTRELAYAKTVFAAIRSRSSNGGQR